jgi:hypothetical protein
MVPPPFCKEKSMLSKVLGDQQNDFTRL